MMDALVVPLAELDRSSTAIAGSKAANLGELLRVGFPVPDGVCITTAAYRRIVAAAGIAPAIEELLRGLDVEDTEKLAATGASIRGLFHNVVLPEILTEAITSAWRTL